MDTSTAKHLAVKVSNRMDTKLVVDTILEAHQKYGHRFHKKVTIHTDQGSQYTSKEFNQTIASLGLRQSMSERGCCLDNAAMEANIGVFKEGYPLEKAKNLKELSAIVAEAVRNSNEIRGKIHFDWRTSEEEERRQIAIAERKTIKMLEGLGQPTTNIDVRELDHKLLKSIELTASELAEIDAELGLTNTGNYNSCSLYRKPKTKKKYSSGSESNSPSSSTPTDSEKPCSQELNTLSTPDSV